MHDYVRRANFTTKPPSFVSKIRRICTLCARVFFSTLLPCQFIDVKLHNFTISTVGVAMKFFGLA